MARKSDLSTHYDKRAHTSDNQSGSALLLLVTALLLLSSTAYFFLPSATAQLTQQIDNRRQEMQQAKEALLMFTSKIPDIYANTSTKLSPGFFLCPDMDALTSASAGSSNGSCSWTTGNAIGRLPTHKTTANGQYVFFSARSPAGTDSLWYVVHQALRLGAAGSASFYALERNPVYDDLPPTLTLDGEPIVAAIIDAGKPLSQQTGRNRDMPANTQWQEHLESIRLVTGGAALSQQQGSPAQNNDQILAISKREFDVHLKEAVCELASIGNWCLTFSELASDHWFKRFGWSHSGSVSRICHVNSQGKIEGINHAQCP